MIRVLIAAPIHEMKDYSIKKWLKSVSEIKVNKECEWFLFMVDNSQNPNYGKKVEDYCKELNFDNYDLVHISKMIDDDEHELERLGLSREKIRQKFLKENWDFWFSWECDIICPPDILSTFLKYTNKYDIVGHTYPVRKTKGDKKTYPELESIGLMLFPRIFFKNYGFTEGEDHNPGDGPLINEIIRGEWKWLSLYNLPVEHLNLD